ncbi:thioredoxin [bacterium]|nr:thioredoxin [bacterium]
MASENVIYLSDSDFDEKVLKSDKPVLVDFFANWCGPCKMIAPYLDELADEYKDKVVVAKLDVDQNGQSAMKYGVRGIPTLILFENGQQKEVIVGADPAKIKNAVATAA